MDISARISVSQSPGGDWNLRHPSALRTYRALFKRSFLLKWRDIAAIISEIIATVLFVVFGILYSISFNETDAIVDDPVISYKDQFGSMEYSYAVIQAIGDGGCFVGLPNNAEAEELVSNYYNRYPVYYNGEMLDLSRQFRYYNTLDEIREVFADTNAVGIGVGFQNIEDPDWYHDINASLYQGPSQVSFYAHMAMLATFSSFTANGRALKSVYQQVEEVLKQDQPDFDLGIPAEFDGFELPNLTMKRMSKPALRTALPINTIAVFIACIPIIIASMPDLSIVLQDKETHMFTYIFLMGASETSYWAVVFTWSFIMCFIPYIVVTILFCTWCGLQGTNYVLLLILTILFIFAFLCFQFFLSTFFNSQSAGRILTVLFLIAVLFFGYMNEMYTLDGAAAVKHVLSIFPLEPYELMITVMYEEVRNERGGLGFGDFTKDLRYPVWACFMWEIIDIILWGGLFILFNATLPREFGSPPLRWSNILRCRFKPPKMLDLEDIASGESVIKVDRLTKQYKGALDNAVDEVSFDIKRGEIIVMIGPNGAGKSTIINTVSGAIPATGDTLSLGGNDPTEQFSGIQNCLGIVFQDNVIMKVLSIKEHLELFGAIRGIDEETLQRSIAYFADMLQLTEMLPNRAGDLSGGQKRKLCIAMALLGNPPIIIMDEPTAGVDVQARQLIWKSISGLKNSTCIVTTHALEEAEAVSSRMFVISNGKMPFAGTSTELRNSFKCGYLLKVDCEPEQMPPLLREIQKFIPQAKMVPERDDTIAIPVVKEIPDMLKDIYEKKESLGIEDYSFAVEQLEDVLSIMLENNTFFIPNQ